MVCCFLQLLQQTWKWEVGLDRGFLAEGCTQCTAAGHVGDGSPGWICQLETSRLWMCSWTLVRNMGHLHSIQRELSSETSAYFRRDSNHCSWPQLSELPKRHLELWICVPLSSSGTNLFWGVPVVTCISGCWFGVWLHCMSRHDGSQPCLVFGHWWDQCCRPAKREVPKHQLETNEITSWPDNVQNMQMFPFTGYIWWFYQILCNRSTFFCVHQTWAQPCWFALYQWRA